MTPPQTKDNSSDLIIWSAVSAQMFPSSWGMDLLANLLSLLLSTPFSLLTRSLLLFPHKVTLGC